MKTIIKAIVMVTFCFCLLSGCGEKSEQFLVYSFSGENELFSISNGVIVITDKNEIFYGGNLEEKQGKLSDIVAYTTSFYILSDDKDRILLSNSVEDMTGGMISIANEMGKVSGDNIIKETEIRELQNNLFFELRTTNLNGEKNEYQSQLTLTEITAGETNN